MPNSKKSLFLTRIQDDAHTRNTIEVLSKMGFEVCNNMRNADAIVFTGQETVSPFLYGERIKNKKNVINIKQDMVDNCLFRQMGGYIPKIGFERGAHLLNVLNGGYIWQWCSNHTKSHNSFCLENKKEYEMFVPSNHTQVMEANEDTGFVEMHASVSDKKVNDFEVISGNQEKDHEVVYYWTSNSVCFQPPIFNFTDNGFKRIHSDYYDYIEKYIKDFLNPKINKGIS